MTAPRNFLAPTLNDYGKSTNANTMALAAHLIRSKRLLSRSPNSPSSKLLDHFQPDLPAGQMESDCSICWNWSNRRKLEVILSRLTAFVNRYSKLHAEILFGGRLLAMDKRTERIRPVVVGYVWRLVSAKCASAHATESVADYFNPLQIGIGVSGVARLPFMLPGDFHLPCRPTT